MASHVDDMGTVPGRALWRSTDLEQYPLASVEDALTRSLDSLPILEPGSGGNWASGPHPTSHKFHKTDRVFFLLDSLSPLASQTLASTRCLWLEMV